MAVGVLKKERKKDDYGRRKERTKKMIIQKDGN